MKVPSTNKRIIDILNIARYAPSSHNTQPWQVTAKGSELIIGYSPARQLSVGDPNNRELFISLGCFLGTMILASKEFGYSLSYSYLGNNPRRTLRAILTPARASETKWSKLVKQRRSDRNIYQDRKLDPGAVRQLAKQQHGMAKFYIYQDPGAIELLSVATHSATLSIMSKQEFRDELAGWVRNNWTKKPDGMPGYTQGMPGPISLIAKFVIRKTKKVAKDQAKKDAKRVLNSAAIGLICIEKNSPEAWIDAGILYQKVCLEALNLDIKSSAVSAALIDIKTNRHIKESLKIDGHPVCLLRLGYSPKLIRPTPRRGLDDYFSETR